MQRKIQTAAFVIVLGLIAIFSKSIQRELIEGYNKCISVMANETVTSNTIVGF